MKFGIKIKELLKMHQNMTNHDYWRKISIVAYSDTNGGFVNKPRYR